MFTGTTFLWPLAFLGMGERGVAIISTSTYVEQVRLVPMGQIVHTQGRFDVYVDLVKTRSPLRFVYGLPIERTDRRAAAFWRLDNIYSVR